MPQMSIWEKETFFKPQDVIIVGSGFTGLWGALHLKRLNPNCTITILERGVIPTGASTRNAGFSCFGSPSELIADTVSMGEASMWKLVDQRFRGLKMIRTFFSSEEINYDPSGGYECFTAEAGSWEQCCDQMGWLNKELKQMTGENEVFKIADEKISNFGFQGFDHMIENKLEAGLHPGRLVQALLAQVQRAGVQILTGIEVTGYKAANEGVTLQTRQGLSFGTKQLLLCTNAFTPGIVPGIDIIPNRGQVLLTSPIEGLAFKGTFHFDQGFYYFRNLDNRVLLGGARNFALEAENVSEMETSEIVQQQLELFLREHLLPGKTFTITDRWTGIMAMGHEKSPIVKELSPDVFCCVRMSGMGVALAPLVALEIATLMCAAKA
ncbi:MAG: FAD-dependent oxidoreductase [Bacteroidota bacterium]